MRSQCSLACILWSAVALSQLVPQVVVAATALSMTVSEDAEAIRQAAEAIMSMPPEHRTFENTLRPWSDVSANLLRDFQTSDDAACQAFGSLCAFWLEVSQDLQFQQALVDCSRRIADSPDVNPFQRYIANRFVENGPAGPLAMDIAILSALLLEDLAEQALSTDADVVCIREALTDSDAHNLCESLRSDYAYFAYVPVMSASEVVSGLFIASKYRLDELRLRAIEGDGLCEVVANHGFALHPVYLKKRTVRSAVQNKTSRAMGRASKNERAMILCDGGSARVSGGVDNEGNVSVEASVKATKETENGAECSAEISGSVKRDKDGHVSSQVKGSMKWDW